MMKKIISLLTALLIIAGAQAQTQRIDTKEIVVRNLLKLGANTVTSIAPSGTGISAASTDAQLATAKNIWQAAVMISKSQGAASGQVLKWNGTAWAPASDNAGGIADADYGDITVSGSGTVMNIDAGVVGTTELTDDAVTTGKIAAGAVGNSDIAANAITTDKIAPSAVEDSDIATGAVGTSEILDGTILAADLSDMGAGSGQVMKWNGSAWVPSADNAGGVTDGDKGDIVVSSSGSNWQIDADAVGAVEIATDAVGASEIATDAVGPAEIATDAVGTAEIAADAVTASEIATDAVAAAEIAAGAVGNGELAAAAVTGAKMGQDGATSGQVWKWNGSAWTPAADASGALADADYGDITVSSSGTVMNIDANVVGNAELRQSAGFSVIGKSTTGTGNVADITAGAAARVLANNDAGTAIGFVQVTNAMITDATITGAKIAQNSATSGQVLKWNGSTWVAANDDNTGGVSDGDKGDVVVSVSGTNWQLDAASVGITELAQMGATTGQALVYGGSAWGPAQPSAYTDQTFTSSGTWTKPSGAKAVHVIVIAGGGGGGSGRKGPSSTDRGGGGGGSGGGYSEAWFLAPELLSSVSVTVGAGGSGGAAQTTGATDGNAGSAGTDSSFGTYLRAEGGKGGAAGSTSTATGGAGARGTYNSGAAGTGFVTAAGGAATEDRSAGSGGGGAGINSSNTTFNGGDGSVPYWTNLSKATGQSGSFNATAGANSGMSGKPGGGGAGGGSSTGTGRAGGAGGPYGGGGGGGAPGTGAGVNSGAGGAGAAGVVVVRTFF